ATQYSQRRNAEREGQVERPGVDRHQPVQPLQIGGEGTEARRKTQLDVIGALAQRAQALHAQIIGGNSEQEKFLEVAANGRFRQELLPAFQRVGSLTGAGEKTEAEPTAGL